MRITIAYYKQSCELAKSIVLLLRQLGHQIKVVHDSNPNTDYTDLAYSVGREILENHADRAILICGLGVCTCIAANKIKGLYAAACYDPFDAQVSRSRYDTNVLCLSECWTDQGMAGKIVEVWLKTPFHERPCDVRSMKKIKTIEGDGFHCSLF
jgi:ribose 5-phosphate isomerase B